MGDGTPTLTLGMCRPFSLQGVHVHTISCLARQWRIHSKKKSKQNGRPKDEGKKC